MNKKEQTSLFILYHNVMSHNTIQEWHPTRVFFLEIMENRLLYLKMLMVEIEKLTIHTRLCVCVNSRVIVWMVVNVA